MDCETRMKRIHALRKGGRKWTRIAAIVGKAETTIKNQYHRWKMSSGIKDLTSNSRRHLSHKQHQRIAMLLDRGMNYAGIAQDYGLCRSALRKMHVRWRNAQTPKEEQVVVDEPPPVLPPMRRWPSHWSEMQCRQMCRLRDRGHSPTNVARMLRLEENVVTAAWQLSA